MHRRTAFYSMLLGLAALAAPSALRAETPSVGVEQVWSRATPQGRTGALYMTVTDKGAPDRLVGVDTDVADKIELHESLSEGGVMRMRPVASIPVHPGSPLVLKPGGYHVMLIGLRRPLHEGESFPVTVRFATAGPVRATARVEKAGAAMPMTDEGTK